MHIPASPTAKKTDVQWICPDLVTKAGKSASIHVHKYLCKFVCIIVYYIVITGGGAAASLTKYLKDALALLPAFHHLKDQYTGKSLRKGAVTTMINHEHCTLIDAIIRGGWDLTSFNTIFEYIGAELGPVSWAGRALANYPIPRRHYVIPTCHFVEEMNVDEKERFDAMLTYLFLTSIPEMSITGNLWPLAYCMMAVFLKVSHRTPCMNAF